MSTRRLPACLIDEGRGWVGLTLLLAFAERAGFALSSPAIHGGDAAARLANPQTLLLGYQLPLPQAFVALGKFFSHDPITTRLIFCVWGALLAAGVTALLGRFIGPRAALFGCILASSDALLTHYSIVPYQEAVAYALLAWGFYLASVRRPGTGAILIAAACLSRYEAWLFVPAFALVSKSAPASLIAALPIVGWTLWWRGLGPGGLYVLDLDLQADRLSRVAFLGRKFLEYENALIPLLAGLALALAIRRPNNTVLKFTGSLALAIGVVVALGHEFPPGSGLMSERLIHLPVLLSLSLAAFALDRISAQSRLAFAVCVLAALFIAGRNIRLEGALLQAAARDPDLTLARETARAIESNLDDAKACVTVLAPAVDPALLERYVAKVDASFGNGVVARERASSLAGTSPDRDRIAAHLRARAGTVRPEEGCPLLVTVDDARPREPHPAMTELVEINAGPRQARLFRIFR